MLRRRNWSVAQSIATAVPLCQAAFSLIFQIRFLSGSALIGVLLSVSFVAYCWRSTVTERTQLRQDTKRIPQFTLSYAWCIIPILISLIYAFAQVLLLPIKNHVALTYHLPWVFLFIQQNSFFIEAFNRYHEVIFPVGADALFYPFMRWGRCADSRFLALVATSQSVRAFTHSVVALLQKKTPSFPQSSSSA